MVDPGDAPPLGGFVRSTHANHDLDPPSSSWAPPSTTASRRSTPARASSPTTPSSTCTRRSGGSRCRAADAFGTQLRAIAEGTSPTRPHPARGADRHRVRDGARGGARHGDRPPADPLRGARGADHRGGRATATAGGTPSCAPDTPPRRRCCGRGRRRDERRGRPDDDRRRRVGGSPGAGPVDRAPGPARSRRPDGCPPTSSTSSRPPAPSGSSCRPATAASAPTSSRRCACSRRSPRRTRRRAGR